MNITPTNTPAPKYPALAALAVAAMVLPACEDQPQPLGGAPLPPPETRQEQMVLGRVNDPTLGPADAPGSEKEQLTPPAPQKPQRLGGRRIKAEP